MCTASESACICRACSRYPWWDAGNAVVTAANILAKYPLFGAKNRDSPRAGRGIHMEMPQPASRPRSFERLRRLPVVGRAMDWGMGPGAASAQTRAAGARIAGLKVTESVCPFCAVGCGQLVYTRGGELVDIEGNPRSPINQGTLCPKGASGRQLIQQPGRPTTAKYRRPGGTESEELPLETATDMIAERM